jgi:GNAT superfamily N-acetyltransferase
MDYNLYLNYNVNMDLDINDDSGMVCDRIFAEIMHETDEAVTNAPDDEDPEQTNIGFLSMLYYNQALAKSYGLTTSQLRELTLMYNSKVLIDLDPDNMSQETIEAVGAATNPNILLLHHFGISAEWRNKGIGEQVVKGLIKQMKGKCGYLVVIKSDPQQHTDWTGPDSLYEKRGVALAGLESDPEKAQFKLNAFWQRCGFRQFKNYDNVFVCNVEQAVVGRMKIRKTAF